MSRSILNKSFNRSGKKATASANINTIGAKESLIKGKNRLNNTVCGAPIKSSSTKFQRNNSHPIPDTTSSVKTPKKIEHSTQPMSLGTLLKFIRPNSVKKKKNPPHRDCSYDSNSAVLSDGENMPAKVSLQRNAKSLVNAENINQHGDLVEYGVPYSELKAPIKAENDDVVNENALNEYVEILDKSFYGSGSLSQCVNRMDDNNNEDVFSELDLLERWSRTERPVDTNVHVIECKPKEIKPKRSALRNTIALPMHFSSGHFRKTPVSLRKCCPRDSISVGLAEEAIERDYDILNKVKHSNIMLLMAASYHRKSLEHMTLVLEPVDYTLSYWIHQMDTNLSIVQSVTIVQQIAGAALYLQECGYIHSNISSHNVLVRENPWCVKLSSFELTTEVDFSSARRELMTEHRHQFTLPDSKCDDAPKYVAVENETLSLRDKYWQMSKLLPTLKCSPNTHLSVRCKHLIYDTNYRQHLSLHNFLAPELLTTTRQFVFPTTKADVYSLSLLLWEMLNNCVPFVVYSKVDMEKMIQSNKLRLPFFEQEKCQPFMDIFKIGLALAPENRTIDVQQLITMLDDIKFQIHSDTEQHVSRSNACGEMNLHLNTAAEEHQVSLSVSSIFSATSTDFDQHLLQNEVTSTKKKQRKSPRKFLKKKTFRQLFNSDDSILSNSQLNREIEAIASEILCEDSESNFNSIVAALSSEENEFPSIILAQELADSDHSSNGNTQRRAATPETVSDKSAVKHCSNLFDACTSESRARTFLSNIASPQRPPSNARLNIEECSLPDNPIARNNGIQRSAWLPNKMNLNLSNKDSDELLKNHDQSQRMNDSSDQLNMSIRIVHNKDTPKRGDNSLVMSKIRFFDSHYSNSKMPIKTLRTSNTKISNNRIAEGVDTNYSENYLDKGSRSKELVELDQMPRNSRPGNSTNPCTSRISQREYGNPANPSSNANQPLMCSQAKGSDDANGNVNFIPSRWPSVRDRISQFEKHCGLTTKPVTVATEFVRNISRYVTGTRSNGVALIKRSNNSIVSGANGDKEIPSRNQMNSTGKKLTDEATLNMSQDRERSSAIDDVDRPKIVGMIEAPLTTSGSRIGLCSPNAEVKKDGSSHNQRGFTNTDRPIAMKTATCESVAASSFHASNMDDHSLSSSMSYSQATPQRRRPVGVECHVNKNIPSTEDLYIDDDFDQGLGLGANIELQSDSCDFLNFDITSSGRSQMEINLDLF